LQNLRRDENLEFEAEFEFEIFTRWWPPGQVLSVLMLDLLLTKCNTVRMCIDFDRLLSKS
jgi:hypothetical protein